MDAISFTPAAASMEFLGAILRGDRNIAITHRITEAWATLRFWNMVLCSTTLSNKMRLLRLHAEVVRFSFGDAPRGLSKKIY